MRTLRCLFRPYNPLCSPVFSTHFPSGVTSRGEMSDNRPKSRQHPEALRNVALKQIYVYALIQRFPCLMTVWPQRSAWRALQQTRWDTVVFKYSTQKKVSTETGSGLGQVFCNGFLKKTPPGKFSHKTYYLEEKSKSRTRERLYFMEIPKPFLDLFLSLNSCTHGSENF